LIVAPALAAGMPSCSSLLSWPRWLQAGSANGVWRPATRQPSTMTRAGAAPRRRGVLTRRRRSVYRDSTSSARLKSLPRRSGRQAQSRCGVDHSQVL